MQFSYTCESCKDPFGSFDCRRCKKIVTDRCRDCHRELVHNILPHTTFSSFAPPCSSTFYGRICDGTVGDPDPWQENVIREYEDRYDDS